MAQLVRSVRLVLLVSIGQIGSIDRCVYLIHLSIYILYQIVAVCRILACILVGQKPYRISPAVRRIYLSVYLSTSRSTSALGGARCAAGQARATRASWAGGCACGHRREDAPARSFCRRLDGCFASARRFLGSHVSLSQRR